MSKEMCEVEDIEISNSKHKTNLIYITLILPTRVIAALYNDLCYLLLS